MDTAYLSAVSALAGSAIGATSSLITTWLAQTSTAQAQRIQREQTRQETLYAEFIDEASRVYAHALSHRLEDLSNMVKLYAIMSRMRLFAPSDVLDQAQAVVDKLINAYYAPNPTQVELQAMLSGRHVDLLEGFSNACRRLLAPNLYQRRRQRRNA